jgi:hypothetical protein
MSVFGFSTEPAGDFMPILKYDARAGRLFRVDRADDGNNVFSNDPVDITSSFKAIVDFENLEVGWIDFAAGSAPDFALVKLGEVLPPRPSERHKNGVRFVLKLAKDCAGAKPIREMAGTSKAFLSGIEAVFNAYLNERTENPGKLPVIVLRKTTPIKSGSGEKQSTNYHPTFEIIGWAPRGDLVFAPKNGAPKPPAPSPVPPPVRQPAPPPATPPATGATRTAVPGQSHSAQLPAQVTDLANDFG